MTSMVIPGIEHPVHVLLQKTAKAVSTKLAGKFLARTKPAQRIGVRRPPKARRSSRALRSKGGVSHG